jgi:fermentation-respiration switch protein FrsA (DUF1100 family)
MLNKFLWTVAFLVLTYVAVAVTMFGLQRDFIYRPDPTPLHPAAFAAAGFQPVTLEMPGLAVPALYFAPATGRGRRLTVLYLHGHAIAAQRLLPKLKPLVDEGWGLALLEYPGYASLPGEPNEQDIYHWARNAAVALAPLAGGLKNIVLWGDGLGAGVATALASEQEFAGVILEAPFTSIADLARPRYPWLPVDSLLTERYDSLSRIDRLKAPLLLGHGLRDELVPAEHGRRLLAAAPEPKRGVFYPEGGHNDLVRHGFFDEVITFLRELVTQIR